MWSEETLRLVGVITCLASALLASSSYVLQKKALQDRTHNRLGDSPIYIAGAVGLVVGMILKLVSYTILSFVTLTVFSFLTIVFSEVFNATFLGQNNSRDVITIVSVVCISVGSLLVLFGTNLHPDTLETMDQLWAKTLTNNEHTLSVVMLTFIISLADGLRRHFHVTIPSWAALGLSALSTGLLTAWSGLAWKVAAVAWTYHLFISFSPLAAGFPLLFVTASGIGIGMIRSKVMSDALEEFSNLRFLPFFQVCNCPQLVLL